MGISRLRLARDVIILVIALIRLVTLILTLVSGATNYAKRCWARIPTDSFCQTATRYSSLRHRVDERVRWCMQMCGVVGEHRTISIISAQVATSRP
jgi:hypothetical protein